MGLNGDEGKQTQDRPQSEWAASSIERLVAYDERLRNGEPTSDADQSLE